MINKQLMKITRAWLSEEFPWRNPYAVTLTLKKGIYIDGCYVKGCRNQYAQNLRHFLNLLNKTIWGGQSRTGWKFSCVTTFERTVEGLPHFHMVLCKPSHLPDEYFAWLINYLWANTTWGRRVNHVVSMRDTGWIDYITKLKTKDSYEDAIELAGTHKYFDKDDLSFKLSMRRLIQYHAEQLRKEIRQPRL